MEWKNSEQTVFTKNYAYYYDLFYKDKPYDKECDFVEQIIKQFLKKEGNGGEGGKEGTPTSILDLACGTGRHSLLMKQRGYDITGTDFSADMIAQANKNSQKANLNIPFHVMPMQQTNLNKQFDVVMGMFHVFGYLTDYQDIQKMLTQTKQHMHNDSILILDFWNGEEVLRDTWPQKVRIFHDNTDDIAKRMIRMSFTKLDTEKHIAQVKFHSLVLEKQQSASESDEGDAKEVLTNEFEETHYMRYFFFDEIKNYLEQQGFTVLKLCPFLDLNGETKGAWNGTIIAKKRV